MKLLVKHWSSSSKPTIDDLKQRQHQTTNKFKDIEDADFKEISPDDNNESEKK